MKVNILGTTKEYENNREQIESIFEYIEKIIGGSNLILSHLEIDGTEIYDDFSNYFLDHIRQIEEVNVITRTEREMYKEIFLSTLDYTERAIPQIEILSNEFYKTPTKETWNKLTRLMEGIGWIINSFSEIDSKNNLNDFIENYEAWNIYAQHAFSLKDLIIELDDIMQNSDLVSLGDILSYEVLPLFKKIQEVLEKLV